MSIDYLTGTVLREGKSKVLANSTKMCYTYDSLSRVTARTIKNATTNAVISTETYAYDAAGNMIDDNTETSFGYDANNRLVSYNGYSVSYDLDGNMLYNGAIGCSYDSANRLINAGVFAYSYDAEDVRILKQYFNETTTYTYDTNCRLSRLLAKYDGSAVTKYVYGLGLIGEEINSSFKTYHFDYRGSTIAITDINGNVTDTFAYDTYGKQISKTGTTNIIFGYNGRDGVITDGNGLIYMRARYYSPDMRRFINADVVAGDISDSTSLNRYSYVNGNPVSLVDPTGLSFLLTLGLIALGAVIGGTVSAVSSAIEQKKENGEVNWKEVAVDAAWGALDGGLSASPLCFVGKTIVGGVISAGQSITDQYFDLDKKEKFDLSDINMLEVGTSVVIDVGFSLFDIKSPNKTKELNKAVSVFDGKIAREKRRIGKKISENVSDKIAKKKLAAARLAKSKAIRGNISDMLIDPFIAPFSPKNIGQNFVEFIVDKLWFDKDEEAHSRK